MIEQKGVTGNEWEREMGKKLGNDVVSDLTRVPWIMVWRLSPHWKLVYLRFLVCCCSTVCGLCDLSKICFGNISKELLTLMALIFWGKSDALTVQKIKKITGISTRVVLLETFTSCDIILWI